MCSNYVPSTPAEIMAHFAVKARELETVIKPETWPGYLAPMIRRTPHDEAEPECVPACFGMVPHWADLKLARSTYNARSETVASKPSFRNAWKYGQFCIVPMAAFYEPNYETGKAVRWRISHRSGRPLGVAGIWDWKPRAGAGGADLLSFSMLTINADAHPLMQRFHAPGDEKRMIVILEPARYLDWLHAPLAGAADFLTPCPASQLVAEPAPLPPKKKKLADAA